MKKYEVIKTYSDKYTGDFHPAGEIVELTEARAKELSGYVKAVKPVKKGKGNGK